MVYSIKEVIARVESLPELKDKFVFDHFTNVPKLPFAAYLYNYNTSGADDYNGVQYIDFRLELYTEKRDIELEQKLLQLFADVEISQDCDYLDSERMYMSTFNFTFPQKITNRKD